MTEHIKGSEDQNFTQVSFFSLGIFGQMHYNN